MDGESLQRVFGLFDGLLLDGLQRGLDISEALAAGAAAEKCFVQDKLLSFILAIGVRHIVETALLLLLLGGLWARVA